MRRGATQTWLAARIGVSYQQLQKYERGRDRIPASRLYLASHVLGVPLDAFFDSVADVHPAEAA